MGRACTHEASGGGDWSGKWQNDRNEGGAEYLKVDQDEKDFISGLWSGDIQFRGERIGPNILFFEGMNKQRQYQCIGVLEGDQLRLEYRAHRPAQGGYYFGWGQLQRTDSKGSKSKAPAASSNQRRSFDGSWIGTFETSKSESGEGTLTLMERGDEVAGELAGVLLTGLRISNTAFHLAGTNGVILYDFVGRLQNDRLVLDYTATSKDERYFGPRYIKGK